MLKTDVEPVFLLASLNYRSKADDIFTTEDMPETDPTSEQSTELIYGSIVHLVSGFTLVHLIPMANTTIFNRMYLVKPG